MAERVRKSGWRKAGWIGLCFVLFMAIVTFIAGSVTGILPYAYRLPKVQEAARKEGVPLTNKEFTQAFLNHPESDAGPVMKASLTKLQAESRKTKDLFPTSRGLLTATNRQNIDLFWKAQQPTIKKIESVQDFKQCSFNRNWDLGPALLFPELATFRFVAKLACFHAEDAARKGDWAEVERSLKLSGNMGRLVASEPFLISYYVGVAIDAITLRTILNIVQDNKLAPDKRAILAKMNQTYLTEEPVTRALRGELFFSTKMMTYAKKGVPFWTAVKAGWESRSQGIEGQLEWILKMPKVADAITVMSMEENLKILNLSKSTGLTTEARQKAVSALGTPKHPPVLQAFSEVFGGTYSEAILPSINNVADARINDLAIRCLDYRDKNSAWPTDFSSFGESGIDPFDGKPMRTKRIGTGLRIWAISRGKKDLSGVKPSSGPGNTVIELK